MADAELTKNGAAAKLTNGLVVYAKQAVDALWKARGYHKMKPKHREEKVWSWGPCHVAMGCTVFPPH